MKPVLGADRVCEPPGHLTVTTTFINFVNISACFLSESIKRIRPVLRARMTPPRICHACLIDPSSFGALP